MSVTISKNELKKMVREKLQCDQGFINFLTGSLLLDQLQEAYEEPSDPDERNDAMDEIIDTYKAYCNTWDLDFEADNRNHKGYLSRFKGNQ